MFKKLEYTFFKPKKKQIKSFVLQDHSFLVKTGIFGPKPTSFRTSAILYYTILYYAIQYILYMSKFAKIKKSNHPTVLTYSGRE